VDVAERVPTGSENIQLQRHGLVDEHYGDALTDEVTALSVLADQDCLKIGRNLFSFEVFEATFLGQFD
jgi:hypothetical protein